MRPIFSVAILLMLVACGGSPGPTSGAAPRPAGISGAGTCPDADPVRDGPFVDAIRTRDAAMIDRALARDPGDARALAARAILTRQGQPDPDQAACFAPYF